MSHPPNVFIDTALGQRVLAPGDWIKIEYTRAENNFGTLVLVLPGQNYVRQSFYEDGIIELWTVPDVGQPYLETQTVWFIRNVKYHADPPTYWEITAFDLNHLLMRRVVDYNPGNSFTEKLGAADDVGKQIVSENFGSGASDTTRSIATWLSIQVSNTLGPSIRRSISRQNVLKVLQDIADASYQAGTYLVFDVVCTQLAYPGQTIQFEFRSYINQRGTDRTQSGLLAYIGPDFGNMAEAELNDNYTNEFTRAISTGTGYDTAQAVQRVDDLTRQSVSPFNLIEAVRSATTALVAADLLSDANAFLRSGIPLSLLSGKLISNSALQYGIDWNWGDLIGVQIAGETRNCHVPVVHVTYDQQNGQTIEPILVQVVP